MTDMTTVLTCSKCGLHYRESLLPHQCADWTKGRKEVTKEQPMSDTLQEEEDRTLEDQNDDDWLVCCQGYTHAPWCANYGPRYKSTKEVTEHEPAAQGGGDAAQRAVAYLVLNDCIKGAYWPDEIIKWAKGLMRGEQRVGVQLVRETIEQHQSLVAERERLIDAIRDVAIRSLRYCEEKYDHDDQARLNLEALLEEVDQKGRSE